METFFVFVNFLRGISRHNLAVTRGFYSAAWTQATFDPDFRTKYIAGTATYHPFVAAAADLHAISPFCLSAMNDYRVEYDAERIRLMQFPFLPSRLSATYAFGDYDTCEEVSRRYRWDLATVRRFRLERDDLTRVHKCNMEIVSLARRAYLVSSVAEDDSRALWTAYWSGQGEVEMELPDENFERRRYRAEHLWEYLIEGRLVLEDGESVVP